jgi:iron complex outermembrane recepter protein
VRLADVSGDQGAGRTWCGLASLAYTWGPKFSSSMRTLASGAGLSILLIFGGSPLTAQEPAPPRELLLFREVPTVITATGREQALTQAPAAVTVITAEQIRQSGATNLPDVLRSVSGLDVARVTATNANVAARGLNGFISNVLQLLIDGRPANDDFAGFPPWFELPLSLEEIDRIEIVKSPSSALYGDRAFGGVVHVITKRPEALNGTSVAVTGGDFGTAIGSVIHGGEARRFAYKVSLGYDRTNQFPNPEAGVSSDDLGQENFFGNFLVAYRLAERSEISLSAGLTHFERLNTLSASGLRSRNRGELGYVQGIYRLGDFKAQYVLNALDAEGSNLNIRTSTRFLAHQLDLQHSVYLGRHVVTGGTSLHFNDFESGLLVGGEQDQLLFGVFVQDEYRLRDDLTTTVGVRLDTHPEAGTSVSPRASLVYTPWRDHTFRASIGTGFRNPTVFENFVSLRTPTGLSPPAPSTVELVGNPNVDPMRLVSYEVGYQTFLFDRVRATVDLFYSDFDDSLEARPDLADPTRLTIVNTDAFSTIGGELGLEVLITEHLKGFVNYSYQDRMVDDPTVPGVVPHHKANAGLTLALQSGFSATLLVHYVGEAEGASRRVDPYTLVNVRLAQRFKVLGQEAELAIQVFNLFDDVHREMPRGDLIERRISGTFRVHF